MAEIDLVSAVLIAYPIGCLATGYYLVLFVSGRDIRTVGSGGIGARNVGRVLGWWAALVTLLVDAGKGILAVILASLITSDRITPLAAMMAVTAGHIWPIQLGLGGGKGVATSLGGLLAWSPLLYTVFVGSFLLGFLVSRKATVSVVALTGAREVAVLQGSGTLANDVIGAQLSFSGQPGVILSNGEFGERLCDHARRFRLEHATYEVAWGEKLDLREIDQLLTARPQTRWLWAVHCETSTGVLNDLERLKDLSRRHRLKLCMDCVSSIGALEVDVSGVHLAATSSGKAIGALPGLSMVFIGGDVAPRGQCLATLTLPLMCVRAFRLRCLRTWLQRCALHSVRLAPSDMQPSRVRHAVCVTNLMNTKSMWWRRVRFRRLT
jgi:acyl-phosphate glycerol 3-phosphate acyltransferase